MTRPLELLTAALIGAGAFYALSPAPDPVVYPEVIVPAARIIEREAPARPPTIIERVRYVTAPTIQFARAPGGALEEVAEFCRPVTVATTDTVQAPPIVLVRSVVHDPAPWWKPLARDGLTVTGPNSHGDLWASDHRVRDGFSVRASGPDLYVRYPRTALLGDVVDAVGLFSTVYTAWSVIR